MLGKRRLGTTAWEIHQTQYQGNVRDAHHAISIAVDGAGLLHVAWDHHVHPLRYSQGVRPGALELTDEMPMIGSKEEQVTYPEFYTLPNGDLLFLYRDGRSGSGNLMINRYEVATGTWRRVQEGLLDGQGQRNAYWQMAVDPQGSLHLSWVWRETSDVATNHDLGEGSWRMVDLTDAPVGAWEPTYDTVLWQREHVLHLFHQVVDQPDGDDRGTLPETPLPRLISVLEWKP